MLVLYCGVGSLVTIAASGLLTAAAFALVPGGPDSASGCFLFFPLEPLPVPVVASLVETAAAVAGPAAAVAWRRLLRSGISFVSGKVSCEIVGMRRMLKLKVLSACSAGFRSRAGFLHQHKCNVRQKYDIAGAAAESAEAGAADKIPAVPDQACVDMSRVCCALYPEARYNASLTFLHMPKQFHVVRGS